jgi:hypothetical protein
LPGSGATDYFHPHYIAGNFQFWTYQRHHTGPRGYIWFAAYGRGLFRSNGYHVINSMKITGHGTTHKKNYFKESNGMIYSAEI